MSNNPDDKNKLNLKIHNNKIEKSQNNILQSDSSSSDNKSFKYQEFNNNDSLKIKQKKLTKSDQEEEMIKSIKSDISYKDEDDNKSIKSQNQIKNSKKKIKSNKNSKQEINFLNLNKDDISIQKSQFSHSKQSISSEEMHDYITSRPLKQVIQQKSLQEESESSDDYNSDEFALDSNENLDLILKEEEVDKLKDKILKTQKTEKTVQIQFTAKKSKKNKNKYLLTRIFCSNFVIKKKIKINVLAGFLVGIVLLAASMSILGIIQTMQQINISYSIFCQGSFKICRVPISVVSEIKGPILFFIKLTKFNQKAFPIANSFDNNQLKDKKYIEQPNSDQKENCKFSVLNNDLIDVFNLELKQLNPDVFAFPCGLQTKFYPADKFQFIENQQLKTTNNISLINIWDGNERYRFYNSDIYLQQWMDVEDPRFFVWMKESSFFGPSKLWGRLEKNLPIGNYFIHIQTSYDTQLFGGEKEIIITGNTGIFSTKNNLLITLLLMLAVSLIITSGFLFYKYRKIKTSEKIK